MPRILRKNVDIIRIILNELEETKDNEIGLSHFHYKFQINSRTIRTNIELYNDLVELMQEKFNVNLPKIILQERNIKITLFLEKI